MMFGGWFSGGGSMAGMSGMIVNGGLAYADRWPPMVLPLGLYRAAEEDDIPEKWRNLARHARKETDTEEMAEQDQTQNQETAERRQTTWKERQQLEERQQLV